MKRVLVAQNFIFVLKLFAAKGTFVSCFGSLATTKCNLASHGVGRGVQSIWLIRTTNITVLRVRGIAQSVNHRLLKLTLELRLLPVVLLFPRGIRRKRHLQASRCLSSASLPSSRSCYLDSLCFLNLLQRLTCSNPVSR